MTLNGFLTVASQALNERPPVPTEATQVTPELLRRLLTNGWRLEQDDHTLTKQDESGLFVCRIYLTPTWCGKMAVYAPWPEETTIQGRIHYFQHELGMKISAEQAALHPGYPVVGFNFGPSWVELYQCEVERFNPNAPSTACWLRMVKLLIEWSMLDQGTISVLKEGKFLF